MLLRFSSLSFSCSLRRPSGMPGILLLFFLAVLGWVGSPSPTAAQVITAIIDNTGDGGGNILNGPFGMAVDGAGNVYVTGVHSDNAFKITPGGLITEIIDSTGDGGANALDNAQGIAVDGAGNVYVTGFSSKNAFKITPGGLITEIIDSTGDGGTNVLGGTEGIAVDGTGTAYVTGYFSDNAFKITPGGLITEIIDSTGDGGTNVLDGAEGIAVDGTGTVYVTGFDSDNAFKITPGGGITEIIDSTGDGGANALDGARNIAVDGAGNVYVTGFSSDNAFKITPGGVITEIIDSTGDGGTNVLDSAEGIAVDGTGNVYVAGLARDNAFKIDLSASGSAQFNIDSPADGETVFGNTVITGWNCDALVSGGVEVQVDGGSRVPAEPANRLDIVPTCSDANNGFVLQTLWSLQTEGLHELSFYLATATTPFASLTVTVVHLVPGEAFIPSALGECVGTIAGTTLGGTSFTRQVRAAWSQGLQNMSVVEIGESTSTSLADLNTSSADLSTSTADFTRCTADLSTSQGALNSCTTDLGMCQAATCGNGIAEFGEVCDGANLQGASCSAQGFLYGTPACSVSCTLDTSGCTNARFVNHSPGIILDNETGLMWEKKTTGASTAFDVQGVGNCLHCVEDAYNWNTAMSDWISVVNGLVDYSNVQVGLGGYTDWRLPTSEELQTLLLEPFPCSVEPCVDPIIHNGVDSFTAATLESGYWSSTSYATIPGVAGNVFFSDGNVGIDGKPANFHVRAVRGGLD